MHQGLLTSSSADDTVSYVTDYALIGKDYSDSHMTG